ncbi:recombinase family protein [Priestia aryabhattai]|uniref:recombinase family protein n=1 Tax=Priestia aryabhattai TaxID=412384 RepID=UPI001C8D1737|nr:recombinase family protein [Priestia aryabhattai]MBY0078511.1 recombinase family protein [Priestia aryabhattai]
MATTKVFGYIRVSSTDQNEGRQLEKLLTKGIHERDIYIDKATGANFERPFYQSLRNNLREGDLVYIDALDRLGRDYDGIKKEWQYITREINADIIILENETLFDSRKFKTMGDMGKLMEDQFLSLLSFVAQQERSKIKQRQAEGIEIAKAQGKHLGRPKMGLSTLSKSQRKILEEKYHEWKCGSLKGVAFMELLELKKNTFYKIVKEYEENNVICS